MGTYTEEFLHVSAAFLLKQPLPRSDAELAGAIAAGDLRAFEQLMRTHNRPLFRTARAILRDDAEAEEAVQDAYLRAYRSIGAFRGDAKLSTWLVRIVANEALARRRKLARRAQIVPIHDGAPGDMEADPSTTDGGGPANSAERSELRRLVEERIDALPEAFRAVFILRALEELTVEETAAALDIPAATVRSRFFRARSQLRESLSRQIDFALEDAFAFAGERCDRIVARVLAGLSQGE